MKQRSILLLMVMVSIASCTNMQQKEMTTESSSSSHQPEPLDDEWYDWLIGQWEVVSGESSLADESGKVATFDVDEMGAGGFNIEFGLNGQFDVPPEKCASWR